MTQILLQNRKRLNTFAFLLLLLIVSSDFLILFEATSLILYLAPIYVIASGKCSTRTDICAIAVTCSLCWMAMYLYKIPVYSSLWVLLWNITARLLLFFIFATFLYRVKYERSRLEESNAKLELLNKEKNKYLGIAAHDMRNPMGNIYHLSAFMLDKATNQNLTAQQTEFIEVIHRVSQHGLALINNMLDISQIEAGTLEVYPTEGDYMAYIREAVAVNSYMANHKGQKISVYTDIEKCTLLFDASYMNQVMNNLLSNAIKYSHPNNPIEVYVSRLPGYVQTTIKDYGLGIKEEDKDLIFLAFEKAQNAPTAGERSSGLGLAIVRKIIEAHRGQIGFDSEYGKGSSFYFTLPTRQKEV